MYSIQQIYVILHRDFLRSKFNLEKKKRSNLNNWLDIGRNTYKWDHTCDFNCIFNLFFVSFMEDIVLFNYSDNIWKQIPELAFENAQIE